MIVEITILDDRIQTPFKDPIWYDLVTGKHRRFNLDGKEFWVENFAHYTLMATIAKHIVDGTATQEMRNTLKVDIVWEPEAMKCFRCGSSCGGMPEDMCISCFERELM